MAVAKNTAYWPERFTPKSLLSDAIRWRAEARAYLDAAATTAAHQSLRKNAERVVRQADENPTPQNLNSAGSMRGLLARSAEELAQDLAALRHCPNPPASLIVYLEPGDPESWCAEAIVHTEAGACGVTALRVHGYASRSAAIEALRDVAQQDGVQRAAQGDDHNAARIRAAIDAVKAGDFCDVRIRQAGAPRPDDWEKPR